jgi:transposase
MDGQMPVRETATQFNDLFGKAGRAWLRSVELPPVERQLLNSELALLDAIQERITESDDLVRNLAAGDPRTCRVRTIPGLGRFFAVLVVYEIGDIHRFATAEKLCGYAGLVPSVHASGGKLYHGRLTKQGNEWLRWAMVEAVRPAVTSDPELRAYYERLRQRKGPNPAKVATARRLLTIVYRVLAQDRPYRKPGRVAVESGRRPRTALKSLTALGDPTHFPKKG